HLWPLDSCSQLHSRQSLIDQLTSKIDVRSVLERNDNLRQTEFRHRAHLLQSRQAANGLLDGKCDPLLDLFRSQRRGDRIDLHLYRRAVWKGVDVQMAQ